MPSPLNYTVRTATKQDNPLIARLCRRAVGPSDYVISILNYLIADGSLLLAFHGTDLVGITNHQKCIDGSVWLGQARTDPGWRRKGVAVFLQHAVAESAQKHGIKTVRMWVLASNAPAMAAAGKGGFKPVCEFAHVTKRVRKAVKGDVRPIRSMADARVWRPLSSSSYLQASNGYIGYSFFIIKPSRNVWTRIRDNGELYGRNDSLFVYSQKEKWSKRFYPALATIAGDPREIVGMIARIPDLRKSISVDSYLPNSPLILHDWIDCGFKIDDWGDRCVVFEKTIG